MLNRVPRMASSAQTPSWWPTEGGDTRVLDFVEVQNTLGNIDEKVRTGGLGPKHQIYGVRDIPSVTRPARIRHGP